MIKLLEEIDELLTYLEDTAHGEEGKRITEMRYKILTELSNSHKHGVMQAEGSEETRRKFCLWYYAQSQPLDANKVFEWFRAAGAAVASEGQGEANTCADCGRTKDEDGTCYSCEYGAMFGH